MPDLPVVTCPHGRHPDVRCHDCESRVFVGPLCHWLVDEATLRDSSPPRDDDRDTSKTVYFGSYQQEGHDA